jgi:hypothetical protein
MSRRSVVPDLPVPTTKMGLEAAFMGRRSMAHPFMGAHHVEASMTHRNIVETRRSSVRVTVRDWDEA